MPKVSIIVPIYNVEEYLSKCLNSLINQTLKDIEIICINDGSTDNSNKILDEFGQKDKRIIIITNENKGTSAARNTGIEKATGEYIAFVDSDDWVCDDFYENLYNAAIKNHADIAVCGIVKINSKHSKNILTFKDKKIYTDYQEKLKICGIPKTSYVWNKIYKRESFIKTNIKFIPNMIYEDYIFTPQILFYLEKLVTVPNTNYYYFRHKKSLIRNSNKITKTDFIKAQNITRDFYTKHNINYSEFEINVKKYKLFNITIYKTITEKGKTKHILFNLIKW